MAGKRVRCKQCGEIFRIDASDMPSDLPADLPAQGPDLDALERSLGGESLDSSAGTVAGSMSGAAGGPMVDAKGKVRIERDASVQDFAVAGGGANALRSNYRYRYAGAKQIDQFMPWVLVVITLLLVGRASLTTHASGEAAPSTAVGVSRFMFALLAYVIIVWPLCHIALKMATTRLRVSPPRAPLWRSFAGFMPVLMLGAGLYTLSGGQLSGLVMGLIVAAVVCVGSITLLFRLFPTEVPTASGYIAAGAIGGGAFAAAVLFAINLITAVVAGFDKNPVLFTSPIAVGLNWVKPPDVVVARPAPRPAPSTAPVQPIVPAPVSPVAPPLTSFATLPLPVPEGNDPQIVKLIDMPPIQPGFSQLIVPPVYSSAMGVVRDVAGGIVECWDRVTWKQPNPRPGTGFVVSQGELAINTDATRIFRLVRDPFDRLEHIPLGNTATMSPVPLPEGRVLVGFDTPDRVIVRLGAGDGLVLERYDVTSGDRVGPTPQPFTINGNRLTVRHFPSAVRFMPDGSGTVVAGLNNSDQAVLAYYRPGDQSMPTVRQVGWRDPRSYQPLSLSVSPTGKVALMLDSQGEAYLTTWDLRGGASSPLLDRKLGPLSTLRPGTWKGDTDPIVWLDDNTLLVYGNYVLDASTGRRIGSPLRLSNVTATYPTEEGTVLYVLQQNGLNTVARVRFDMDAIQTARGQ
jgi:hypothetical protein